MRISTKARILRAQKFGRMEVFAKKAGISPTRWKFFETATGGLSASALERAAVALGVKIEEIADERGFPVGV